MKRIGMSKGDDNAMWS